MLKRGALILSVWCWLNVVPAVASLLSIALGKHAPGLKLLFTPGEISSFEGRALAMIDGLATLLNTLIAVYCITCFFLVRRCVLTRQRWSLLVFAIGALTLQVACYLADHFFLRSTSVLAIHISSLLLVTGFALCSVEIFKNPQHMLPPRTQAGEANGSS